ncbi:MAG: serine/threonine-protein phosphatase [Magnetococcales bacterium]|nr:serine/threonine-protein phosphatase [Magnetococcales bacterium]MBF0154621.1 serine/threonine-protein phosphatase [Magnetococcales bacterium]MBF0308739.1 serine/threonine-protein phosphatase [Magnetococcales bacterium]
MAKSDVGLVRTLNEDTFLVDPGIGLLVVADGMGGHDAGEVASAKVVEVIAGFLKDPVSLRDQHAQELNQDEDTAPQPTIVNETRDLGRMVQSSANLAVIRDAVTLANSQLYAMNQKSGYREGSGMGSTVVGFWMPEGKTEPVVFHVGDSRLYQFRRGKLRQVTLDHSMYQHWKDMGGRGQPPASNILLQAMGPVEDVSPEVRFFSIEKGDVLLLCSDGLSGMVPDEKLAELMATVHADALEKALDTLIDQAKKQGGKDNITAILGYVTD